MRSFIFCLPVFFALILAPSFGRANENETTVETNVEEDKAVDNDDIAEKVEQPPKLAQSGKSKGVVWGKSSKVKSTEEVSTEDPVRKATDEKAAKTSAKTPPPEMMKEAGKKTVREPIEETPQPLVAAQKTTVQRPVSQPNVATPKPIKKSDDSDKKYLLKSNRKSGSTDLVETLLEVTGDVKQVDNDLKTVTDKMEVVAGFRYEERLDRFSASNGPLVSVRQYNLAKAKMKVADEVKTPQLDEKLQTIVCILDKDKVSLFSPQGSLRGEELLLVEDLPGNTLTLDRLLPNKEVAIGDSWTVSDSVLRSFLSVDAVTESNVEAVLTTVADNMAMIEAVGDVSGIYLGAFTEMSVRAKFQFDLTARRINWLGLLIEENRSIGHVGPGFDLVARLQVKISPIETPQSLTDDVFEALDLEPKERVLKLKYDGGKGPWRFSHNRDWYISQDDAQTTILRKLHKGELVAQCNIADMGKVDVKTMTSLRNFQKELKEGLGESFGKIALAEERQTPAGYKEYLVLIDGIVDDLPLRWIYHLLTDEDGRQAVVVFVVEAAMLESFDDADEVLLKTFRLGKK